MGRRDRRGLRAVRPGRSLADHFRARFGQDLDEDAVNHVHESVLVASALDDSTERIVTYLSARNIAINVVFFQVFAHGDGKLLRRAWLLDPVRTQAAAVASPAEGPGKPWNGEFYASFCHNPVSVRPSASVKPGGPLQ